MVSPPLGYVDAIFLMFFYMYTIATSTYNAREDVVQENGHGVLFYYYRYRTDLFVFNL